MTDRFPRINEPLSGFTLFQTANGWQMSYRVRGEDGWSVHVVNERTARLFLDQATKIPGFIIGLSNREEGFRLRPERVRL